MEIAMEFATFCNICFNKNNLRKIEQTEDLKRILMLFIENKILIKEQEIYLCLNCCEKLESYDKFKEMCLRNFIDFRIEYSELKKKLEMMNDPNMENKLRNFIETKVNGVNDRLNFDASEDPLNVEDNIISGQKSDSNISEKEDEYSYNLHNVKCKMEKVEYDEIEDYKLRTELDLEENPELPVPIEHIKLESYAEEDVYTSESSSENVLIKQLRSKGPYQMNKSNDLITDLIHEEHSSVSTLNKNEKSTSRKTSDVDCEICKKTFSSASSLTRHIRIHTGEKPYTCKPCNKSFTSSTALRNHEQVHSGEKLHSCDVCNKTFATESYLESHKWVHNEDKRHICKICNKGFCLSKRLKKHMIIHTDKKPFPCLRCSKKFRTSRELKRHERAHTGEKPYACTMCDKTFSQNGNLKKHELVHTGEKPYTCGTCQKPFRHVNHLRTHERVHTGEKPYECTLCGKRFTNGTSFKSHKLTHTGEKPYSCTVCNKSFRKSNTLREHEFIHTGVKPYSCDICKKKFTWGSELRLHKKKPCVQNVDEEKEIEEPEKT